MHTGLTWSATAQPYSSSTLWRSALPGRAEAPPRSRVCARGALRRVLAVVEAGVVWDGGDSGLGDDDGGDCGM
jgi:hypothetical protein